MFWVMPMICPAAYRVYLKSKKIGALAQTIFFALALGGAYQVIDSECRAGNCTTQNPAAMLFAGVFAGMHMIAMLAALVLMCIDAARTVRVDSAA